jgi:plasmid stability protein
LRLRNCASRDGAVYGVDSFAVIRRPRAEVSSQECNLSIKVDDAACEYRRGLLAPGDEGGQSERRESAQKHISRTARACLQSCNHLVDAGVISCNHVSMNKGVSLTVRNLSPVTKAKLAKRAARKGRSLEAEVRALLDAAANERTPQLKSFPDWFIEMIEPGEDDVAAFLETRRKPHAPVEL